jgi:hypothetical protein
MMRISNRKRYSAVALTSLLLACGPVLANHVTELPRIFAPDPNLSASFGGSVAVSGNTAVVGALGDDTTAANAGAAYVYRWENGGWRFEQKLLAANGATADLFGTRVAIDGDTIAVAAPGPGGETQRLGSVYIWVRQDDEWVQQDELVSSDVAAGDNFGISMALSNAGDRILVGAYGDQNAGTYTGAAYLFERQGSVWSQVQKLLASDLGAFDYFGFNVALDGDRAAICATGATNVYGELGVAYVFEKNIQGVWAETELLATSDTSAGNFCRALDMDQDTVVVGAYGTETAAGVFTGAVYEFKYGSGGTWSEGETVIAPGLVSDDHFGWSVAIDGANLVVGAEGEDSNGAFSGSIYAFRKRPALGWQLIGEKSGDVYESYGRQVALDGGIFLTPAAPGNEIGRVAAYRIDEFVNGISVGDVNSNGVPDLAVLMPGAIHHVHVRDGSTDALLTDIDIGSDLAFDMVVLPDLDGSGDPEIAILQQQPSGQVRVQARDSVTGGVTSNLWYGLQYEPVSMTVVPDYNASGFPEVAVLGSEAGTDAVRVQIRDADTNTFLDNVFLGTQSIASDLVSVTDTSGNGIPEMGILGVLKGSNQVRSQVWDADTAAFQTNIWFGNKYQPQSMITMPDINSNGSDEIVAMGVDPATQNIRVQVRDSDTTATLYNIWLGAVNEAVDIALINDINSDGVSDLAVLLKTPGGTGRVRVQSGLNGAFIRNLFYTVVENPVGLAVMSDYSGNGFDELAALGDNGGMRHVQVLDTVSGSQVNSIDFP